MACTLTLVSLGFARVLIMPAYVMPVLSLSPSSRSVSCSLSVRLRYPSSADAAMACGCPVLLLEGVRAVLDQVVAPFYLFHYRVVSWLVCLFLRSMAVLICLFDVCSFILFFTHSYPVPGNWRSETGLENRKTGRKRPKLLENRRKLGQIDEKNARNLKKALPGRENGARVEFQYFGQNAKNRQASQENKLEHFAKSEKKGQISANNGKIRRKNPTATCTYATPI